MAKETRRTRRNRSFLGRHRFHAPADHLARGRTALGEGPKTEGIGLGDPGELVGVHPQVIPGNRFLDAEMRLAFGGEVHRDGAGRTEGIEGHGAEVEPPILQQTESLSTEGIAAEPGNQRHLGSQSAGVTGEIGWSSSQLGTVGQ